MEDKKVIAIVVTYNRKELLRECINALLDQEYNNCDILIVDNASTDGTKEYISDELKNSRVHYVNTGKNLGGAGGFNYGMKEAFRIGCDFMWIMDDDCIVHKGSLTELLKADNQLNGEYGFLSSKVLWRDNSICTMNIQKRKFSKWLKDFKTNMQPIAMASFVSLFIKSEIVEELGLPIKDFFIWTDDWEYTRRISRKYKCYYVSKSIVTHKSKINEGASIATVDGDRLERFKYMYRNDVVLYRREGIKGWMLLYMRLALHKLRILKSSKNDKKDRIKIIDSAIKEGKKFNPKIEYVCDKVKVLQVFGEPLSNGGQEAFIMNIYDNIDRNKVKFDFFTPYYCDNMKMREKIELYGGEVIAQGKNFETKKRKRFFVQELTKFLKKSKYDIVHIHSGSIFVLAYGAKIANKYGARKIIVHSHCTGVDNIKYKIVKMASEKIFIDNATNYLACSREAAIWKFPQSIIENEKFVVIKNGIQLEKFKYLEKIRTEYRSMLDIKDNEFVIGNVGRFEIQKNHEYLLEIFEELSKKMTNSKLILVGTGTLKEKIIKQIKEKKLQNKVIILEKRDDVNKILQAMDVFVFPSFFEGLGIVAIEAQAAGLHTICSENIPPEANMTDLFHKLNISDGKEVWVNEILKYIKYERSDRVELLRKNGYEARESAKIIENIYLN